MFPSPVAPRLRVVDGRRPGIGDLLSVVGGVGDLEAGDVLAYFCGELSRREAHSGEVVAEMAGEPFRFGLHYHYCRLQSVGHVHHREYGVLSEEADIGALLYGSVENLDGVVGRPTPRGCYIADQP